MGHRNKHAGKKCGRIHGHTYDVVCEFEFVMKDAAVTMLFSDIDEIVEPIVKKYDHYLVLYENDPLVDALTFGNEDFLTVPFETSAENMAIWIFKLIKNDGKLPIRRIELAETKSSTIIYEEDSD